MVKMWKFVRGKSQQHTAERQKLQKELFSFCKTVQHGFPNKPTALAWDPQLRIAAVGTAAGAIKVVGQCGVEFLGQHSIHDPMILRLLFVPNEGKLISLCDNNSLHLWRVNDSGIEEIESIVMEGKAKRISALYIDEAKKNLLVGTEGGNIYSVDLDRFSLSENIIYQDVAMQNVPDGKKVNPGAVEAVAEQPGYPDNLLIGYRRGLMVLWNKPSSTSVQTYVNNQQLESFCWDAAGKKFVSSHNDGSYVFWSTESVEPVEEPITVYGPFPCKAITKIEWCRSIDDSGDNLIVFSGGMPRASYSDRNTVTIQKGSRHVVLDFTSKVIDFFITYETESDVCESLIILLEEELVAVDLTDSEWRTIPLPYLISLHSSAVTVMTYVNDVCESVWNILQSIGKQQTEESHSLVEWPINGGVKKRGDSDEVVPRDLLITGHEDGSVRFWNAGSVVLSLMYTFKTNAIFIADDELDEPAESHAEEEEEEWPPFRKVGCFDPFSDDPRLAIKKISMCPNSGALLIAGSAGQIVILKLNEDSVTNKKITVSIINIIPEKDNPDEVTYLWKGPQRLGLKSKTEEKNKIALSLAAGYQPDSIVQILPPAAVTAIALSANWHLIAVGTAHGLALYDFKAKTPVLHRCTLNSNDYSSLSETPISRTKSFKKSLRESFRRIRGRSSVRQHDKHRGSKLSQSPVTPTGADRKRGGRPNESVTSSSPVSPLDARPVERAIEARPTDDAMGSMVKCLNFFNTNVVHAHHPIPSLWAGTNNGTVYIFTLNIPGGPKRKNDKVIAQLGKEIQLRHRAPVVSISAINLNPKLFQVDDSPGPPGAHYVIICSEEQIKIFSLPNLKPVGKLKLTALEGARVRRVALGQFSAGKHVETCLMFLTNLGECIILSIPDLRRQETAAVIKREDINGISSFSFTKYGEGLFFISSSELQRISLSVARRTSPRCSLSLAHTTKDQQEASPIKAEKHDHFINGIPEEEEEEVDEEVDPEVTEGDNENNDSLNKKDSSGDHVKKPYVDDENIVIMNHDVSAITLDSVKDHMS